MKDPGPEGAIAHARDYFHREAARIRVALETLHRLSRKAAPHDPSALDELLQRRDRWVGEALAANVELPFIHAMKRFELNPLERELLTLAVAAQASMSLGVAIQQLSNAPWPTLGLALSLVSLTGRDASPFDLEDRSAVVDGLIELSGDGPLPTRAASVDAEVAAILSGSHATTRAIDPDRACIDSLIATPAQLAKLSRWAAMVGDGARAPKLVLIGQPGSGRRLWARAACAMIGRPLVVTNVSEPADVRRARRRAVWCNAIMMLRFGATPSSARNNEPATTRGYFDRLRGLSFPPIIAVQPRDAAALVRELDAITIEVGPMDVVQRATLWSTLLPRSTVEESVLRSAASTFALRSDQIARAARRVSHDGNVVAACREVAAQSVGDLARRIEPHYTRADLVLPEKVGTELDLAIGWARHRVKVLDDWGFAKRLNGRGLAALFAGKPGTGKTTAAHVLAAEIGLDLLHVDLSQVVNKYVGETEKHLSRLFDDAGGGAVLFFDEADALFGRRSQVRDAHDRYANIEIGYLLQRMEAHDGVTILATNRHSDLDDAFIRRFHVSITFPIPDVADRTRLWHRMLPATAPKCADLPIDRIAADYELSGGDIQTAALGAAFLAAAANEAIGTLHLYRGVQRVLAKNGVLPDPRMLQVVRSAPS